MIEKHPELEGLVKKYSKIKLGRGRTLRMGNTEISKLLMSEHNLKIHRTSVPNIFKDIELK